MKLRGFIIAFFFAALVFSQSVLAFAFSVAPTSPASEPYTAEEYLAGSVKYHNIKNPSGIVCDDLFLDGADYNFYFVADEDSGLIYGFSSHPSFKEFVISDPALLRPKRLRVVEKQFLLVLDGGQIHIFDFRPASGTAPKYAGTVAFSAGEVSVKDFMIRTISGMTQLYVITTSNAVYQFAITLQGFVCALAGDLVSVYSLAADETPVALAGIGDWVYILCTSSYIRYRIYPNTQERLRTALDVPRDIAVASAESADTNELVLICDNGGVSGYSRGNQVSNTPPRAVKNTSIKSGEIITVGSMSLYGNKLFVADISAHAKCVQRFLLNNDDSLVFDNLFVGGKGGDSGRLYEPSDIAVFDERIYVADTQNKRIQIWENNTVLSVIDTRALTIGTRATECPPVALTVTETNGDTVIYAATSNGLILALNESGTLIKYYSAAGGQTFGMLSGITSDADGNVYASDERARVVYKKAAGDPADPTSAGFSVLINGLTAPTALAVSMATGHIFVADKNATGNGTAVKVFDTAGVAETDLGFNLDSSLATVTAMVLDDRDTVYLFADKNASSILNRYLFKTPSAGANYYEQTTFVLNGGDPWTVRGAAINRKSGNFFFADTASNIVKVVKQGDLGIYISDDAPANLTPPVYIKNSADPSAFHSISAGTDEAEEVRVAEVSAPGAFIYPIETQYETHANYPLGYAVSVYPEPVIKGEKLIVLSSNDFHAQNGYAYVLYKGLAGFIKSDKIDITERDLSDRPYANVNGHGLILYENAEIFKYPVLEKHTDGSYYYQLGSLKRDTAVTVVCRVKEPLYNSYFYEITYCGENSDPEDRSTWETVFVRRYDVSPDSERNTPSKREGRIKALVNKGFVEVFEEPDGDVSPDLRLRDNTRVEIKSEINGWVEVKWTEGGNTRSGFIEDKYIIYTGMTAMQIVGLLILVLAVATAIITLRLKRPKKKEAPPTDAMRF